jgi:4-carboxymuconolactone decarboxylase
MTLLVAAVVSLTLITSVWAQGNQPVAERASKPMPARGDVRTVAPALEKYTQDRLLGDVWKRPGLAPRDRSIVTSTALIARNQTIELPYYLELALDHGVKPREVSEIITHLAFYSGWGNAMSAIGVAKEVFARRHIGTDQLPQPSPPPLPLNEAAEADRAARVSQQFGAVAPGVVQYTTDVLFRDQGAAPMTTWTRDELRRIDAAEELELASVRRDGTLREPVTIWVVRVGDDLYVRSWKGRTGAWFRATQLRREGHIQAGGVAKDVTFVREADDDINDQIDAAYRRKYRRHGGRYVDPMVVPAARAATIKLVPRS